MSSYPGICNKSNKKKGILRFTIYNLIGPKRNVMIQLFIAWEIKEFGRQIVIWIKKKLSKTNLYKNLP